MAKLNQIIAVEQGERNRSHKAVTELYKKLQSTQLFQGLTRDYQPKDEEGEQLPTEKKRVEMTVEDAISEYEKAQGRLIDVTSTKDHANTQARADVVVDGDVIVENVPVTFLLFLEKKLIDTRTFISKIPTLDTANSWDEDPNTGLYKSEPYQTNRTQKQMKNHVIAEATKEHPAQVEVYTEDVVIGHWTKTDFSGAIPQKDRKDMLERVDKLIKAVKYAREEANSMEVEDKKVAEQIFGYLFK